MYLIGIFFTPLNLVGLIIAVVNCNAKADWINNHHRFQIRTAWIGILYGLACLGMIGMSSVVYSSWPSYIGLAALLVQFVWFLVRTIRGMKALAERREPNNWRTWGF